MGHGKVYLAPAAHYGDALLDALDGLVSGTFNVQVERMSPKLDLAAAYSTSRHQYSAENLMAQLVNIAPGDGKILAMVDVDIFVPIFTFIFGEAQLGGKAALLSTWRLRPEVYGEAHDKALFMERVFKEAMHELGHAFGLKHCYTPGCVMNFSPTIDHVDEKGFKFCPVCTRGLQSGH